MSDTEIPKIEEHAEVSNPIDPVKKAQEVVNKRKSILNPRKALQIAALSGGMLLSAACSSADANPPLVSEAGTGIPKAAATKIVEAAPYVAGAVQAGGEGAERVVISSINTTAAMGSEVGKGAGRVAESAAPVVSSAAVGAAETIKTEAPKVANKTKEQAEAAAQATERFTKEKVAPAARDGASAVVSTAEKAAVSTENALQQAKPVVQEKATVAVEKAGDAAKKMEETTATMAEKVGEKAPVVAEKAEEIASQAGSVAKENAQKAGEAAKDVAEEAGPVIAQASESVLTKAGKIIKKLGWLFSDEDTPPSSKERQLENPNQLPHQDGGPRFPAPTKPLPPGPGKEWK